MNKYREWHQQQCRAYSGEIGTYRHFAETLGRILNAACRVYAPHGIVQAREKSLSSFAEKMARKAARYSALGISPTDLCGARIIVETQAEVERICAWIRDALIVDEVNSVDVRTRLKVAEFGYLSVHYVVQLRGSEALGVPIPPEISLRKAEIQVRTLLEHAWASIFHDRIYKAGFRVPEHLKRDVARVAALLEEADEQFGATVRSLDAYKPHYGAYMDKEGLAEEVEVLETVLENEPDPARLPAGALRLAQLARATGNWARLEQLLAPYTGIEGAYQAEVLAEHGNALCQLNRDRPLEEAFRKGQAEIAQAVAQAQGDVRTRSLAYRAWASAQLPENEEATRENYRAAYVADPDNPFHLASHIEYEMYCGESLGLAAATGPTIRAAIAACRAYADANIELPWAFLTMGRLLLLLDDPYASLAAYARGIRVSLGNRDTVPEAALDAELAFLRHINRGRTLPEKHKWAQQQILLAKAAMGANLAGLKPERREFRTPVVILAGGTSTESKARVDVFRENVLRAFEGFRGTVISGGTRAGVAGLAGELAAAGAKALGYVPTNLPYDQPADDRYTALVVSDGAGYGAGAPLQYWTDLLLAGVRPGDVKVVGIDGGPIAAFEYRLALALGAQVGLLTPSTRAAATLQLDPDWKDDPNLIVLPKDAMTLHAFILAPRPALAPEQVDAVAQRIHLKFLDEHRYSNPDSAMQPWDNLREDLKNSNRMQASYAAAFLEEAGYRVEPLSQQMTPSTLSEDEIDRLAEMEHGRWVIERLQSGWRYGEKRDPSNKLSPFLIPWEDLSKEVRGYDCNAVRAWPARLAEAGLQLSRP
jgi:ppGpp synthetase/RelA/SpoT-type nucleotidyltranferase